MKFKSRFTYVFAIYRQAFRARAERRAGLAQAISRCAVQSLTVLRHHSESVIWLGKIEGVLLPAASFTSPADFEAACSFLKETHVGA